MSTTTKQKPLVPELRFSGFDGEWQNTKFRKLITSYKGGAALTPSDFVESGGSKVIPKKAIGPGGELNISLDKPTFCTTAFFNSNPNSVVNSSYLITTLRDLVPSGPSIGYVVKFIDKHEYVLAQGVYGFIMNEAVVSKDFFVQYSNTNVYRRLMIRTKVGSTQVHIRTTDYMKLVVQVPPLPEQQKIADFLGSVDAWLDNLRGQKIGLQSYKLGMMQKLFTQQVRFKDESGKDFPEWEGKELGELLDYKQPTEFIVESTEYSDDYDTPVLTAGKTFILGYTDETKGIFDYELPVIIFDDFTTATKFVDFNFKVKSSAMKILVPLNNNNVKFLYEAMQHIRYEVGGHGRHWISKYSKLTVATPCLAEQKKIVDFVTTLDESIETKTKEITKVEEWKKGLMQKMFIWN